MNKATDPLILDYFLEVGYIFWRKAITSKARLTISETYFRIPCNVSKSNNNIVVIALMFPEFSSVPRLLELTSRKR